jgi:hypothetical protein
MGPVRTPGPVRRRCRERVAVAAKVAVEHGRRTVPELDDLVWLELAVARRPLPGTPGVPRPVPTEQRRRE